ncbi:hypothetical protein C8J57DRAFT_33645 [Mycena rebaudengoi]|nr:hypothetical protein C8J57DRAFT_33645 [Mycena rebaudengoi]
MLTTPPSARISALPPGAGAAYSPASYSPRDSGAFEIESPRNSIAPAASLTGSVSPTASHTSTSPSYVSPPTSYISTTSSSASYATAREPSGFSVLPILSANFPSESANGVTGLPVDSSRIIDASTGGLPSSISGLPSSLIPGNSSNIINANTGRLPSSSTSGLPSSLIPGMVSPHSPNQRGFSVSSITSGGVSGLPAPSGYSSSAANSGPYAQHQPQYANAHNLTVGAAGGAPLNLPSPTFSVISVSSVGSFQTARSRNSVSTVGSRRRANGSESGSSVSTARSRSRSSGSEYGGEEDADVTSRLSLNLPRTGSPTEMGDASLASAASAGANTPTPRNASTPTPTPQKPG